MNRLNLEVCLYFHSPSFNCNPSFLDKFLIQRGLKTYIVMAKHNSLWFASCPRLCMGGKVGVWERRERRGEEGGRRRGEGKRGEAGRYIGQEGKGRK